MNNVSEGLKKTLYFTIVFSTLLLNSCNHSKKELRAGIMIFPGPNDPHSISMKIFNKLLSEETSFFDYSDTTNVIENMDSTLRRALCDYLNVSVELKNANIYDWRIRRSPFENCKIYYFWKGKRTVLIVNYRNNNSYFILRQGDLDSFNKVVSFTGTSIKDTQDVMEYVKIFLLSVGYMTNKDIVFLRSMEDWDDFVSIYEKMAKRRKKVYWDREWSVIAYYNYLSRRWEDEDFVKKYSQSYENRLIQGPVHYTDALLLEGYGHMEKGLPIYIKEDIKPPEITEIETGYKVELYCWTLEGGNFDYWRVNIQKDGQVSYKKDRLGSGVGPFIP